MNRVLVFTGAGLSAEAGLETFNTDNGTWAKHDVDEVCNINTFRANREKVFSFYSDRREQLGIVNPTKTHLQLSNLQKKYGTENVKIYTQNVDDLLERAGCEVTHIHGKLTEMVCMYCGDIYDIGYTRWDHLRPCVTCKSETTANGITTMKPNVVFYGEQAPEYQGMFKEFSNSRNDIILVIGTSGNVVNLDKIVGNRYTPNKSYTILNNLSVDVLGPINYRYFDKKIFKPATQAIDEIVDIIDDRLGQSKQ